MRKSNWMALIALVLFNSSAFSAEPTWSSQMQQFKTALGDLLPYIASEKSFNAPENAVTIQSKIKKLSEIRQIQGHQVTQKSNDPLFAYVSAAFSENLELVEENLTMGRRDYARYLLMNTSSYCIECHTRNGEKPEFFGHAVPGLVSMLGPIEKVEFLISSRQYRDAMKSVDETFKDENFSYLNPNADRMARYGLILSVRYFQDPDAAEKFVKRLDGPGQTPFFLQREIKAWKKAISEWKKTKAVDPKKLDESIPLVETLVKKASAVNRKLESEHAGDIYALRAYSIASDLLRHNPSKSELSKLLMLMGDTHQDSTDGLFWAMPRFYYEACIKTYPHTNQAGVCFKKFEEATRIAYSNSLSMIPLRTLERLKELKALSELPSQKN